MIYAADIAYRNAMRILIDIPTPQIEALAAMSKREKQPRAAIVRAAVADYLERHSVQPIGSAFGAWGTATPDGLDYQRSVRAEW